MAELEVPQILLLARHQAEEAVVDGSLKAGLLEPKVK
jgi:hypothetical protein